MPIKRFWLFNQCVERLQASDDLRVVSAHGALNSQDAFNGLVDALNERLGTIVIQDYERDTRGINDLKSMIRQG